MLCHRLYISIVSVDFFDKLLYTYLIRLQTEYLNFHANNLIRFETTKPRKFHPNDLH